MRIEWTDGKTLALLAYRNAGMTAAQIAKEMGLTRNQVLGRIWRAEKPELYAMKQNLWTDRQKDIARRGALFKADLADICAELAKAGRTTTPLAVKRSNAYREGVAQAVAIEERLSHSFRDRHRHSQAVAAVEPEKNEQRAGTYRCPHFPNDRINLPIVKGYVGEQAHG